MDKNFWQDRAVFVTGATGLVGSWLVKELEQVHADTVCLVRDWVPQSELVRSEALKRVKVVTGNIEDQALLERILGEYEINTVFHLAAQTIVSIANRNPVSTFETNIAGTYRLMEACRRSPTVKQVIVASSDKAYGNFEGLAYTEDMPLQGKHPYDVSKSCADLIAQSYAETFGTRVAVTRCGNLFGGGDLNWNRIIPGTVRSVLRGDRPIIRSDGTYVRDYFYVEDAVQAYMLLAERLFRHPEVVGGFNFSYEEPRTVLELTKTILSLMKSGLEPYIQNEARHEIVRQCLSATKARTMLEWKPAYTLETSLQKTIEWYQQLLGVQ